VCIICYLLYSLLYSLLSAEDMVCKSVLHILRKVPHMFGLCCDFVVCLVRLGQILIMVCCCWGQGALLTCLVYNLLLLCCVYKDHNVNVEGLENYKF
jgi:hypothetical protein